MIEFETFRPIANSYILYFCFYVRAYIFILYFYTITVHFVKNIYFFFFFFLLGSTTLSVAFLCGAAKQQRGLIAGVRAAQLVSRVVYVSFMKDMSL